MKSWLRRHLYVHNGKSMQLPVADASWPALSHWIGLALETTWDRKVNIDDLRSGWLRLDQEL